MSQYSLKITKIRIQIRKINVREIFSSYMGIEVRIIVTKGEICEEGLRNGIVDPRKNWWMKSVYRDDDIWNLIQHKFF